MTLTFGLAPFASRPLGTFNFTRQGPDKVLYWADFPKRFRAMIAGETIVDTHGAKMLHETDAQMRLCFPLDDVRMDLLESAGTDDRDAAVGVVRRWNIRVGGRLAEDAATSFESPPETAAWLKGFVTIDLSKVDAWFQEDDPGYAHPRDPFHRVDVHVSSRHVVVRLDDTVIAETRAPAMLFETSVPTRYYLPPEAVRTELLEKSQMVSQCPYKGDGEHWHVQAGSDRVENAMWSLPSPLGDAVRIPGWFSFYPNKVSIEVDGERLND